MLDIQTADDDAPELIELVRRIATGAIAALGVHEVYLVKIDNWFDFKWLGWWSWAKQRGPTELCVPPFSKNRVRNECRYLWDVDHSRFVAAPHKRRLHPYQPGRSDSFAKRLDEFSDSAAFVWYSGNSLQNRAASLMFYLSGAEGYAWYASFAHKDSWQLNDQRQITRKQLIAFLEAGGALESAAEPAEKQADARLMLQSFDQSDKLD